jgi:fatty-acyl-CoA synthase
MSQNSAIVAHKPVACPLTFAMIKIYPLETVNVLIAHPKVLDAAVFGVPNEDFGEEVKAVVHPVDMASAGPDLERELIAHCRSRIAHIKCPRSIAFSDTLPRHDNGKLLKRLIREQVLGASA